MGREVDRAAILEGMARYRSSVNTPRHPEDAFQYMASFENVAEWDPGVVEAVRLGSDEPGMGSRFRVVVSSAGRKLPLEYRIGDRASAGLRRELEK